MNFPIDLTLIDRFDGEYPRQSLRGVADAIAHIVPDAHFIGPEELYRS
jgi:hypothetical protein